MRYEANLRIFLVGFMGTGKSTVARLAAEQLSVASTDMDERIEEQESRSIAAIFETDGEMYFRRIEQEVLATICREFHSGVIACGGGVVLNPENVRLMKQAGRVICLSSRPEVIYARIKHQTQRPLLQVDNPEQRIRELLAARHPYYQQADATVDTSDITPQQAAVEVVLAARSITR